MDEAWWERSRDPGMMLQCVRHTASARKLRLFASACWQVVAGPISPLVALGERLADDPTADLLLVGQRLTKTERTLLGNPWETARDATAWKPEVARRAIQHKLKTRTVDGRACWEAWTAAQCEWASLAREIFGSPYRPVEVRREWPLNTVELAHAIYQGHDCGFALHDALTEAGEVELAEHFAIAEPVPITEDAIAASGKALAANSIARPRWHPKGCWAVDLILGKK